MRSPHGTTIRGILQCEYYLDLFCVLINDVIDVPFHSCSRLFVDSNLYIMFYVLLCVVLMQFFISCISMTTCVNREKKISLQYIKS
jgi:hypothetical protein